MRVGVGVQGVGRIHPQHLDLGILARKFAGLGNVGEIDAGNAQARARAGRRLIGGVVAHVDAPVRTVRSAGLAEVADKRAKRQARHGGVAAVVVCLRAVALVMKHRAVDADVGQILDVFDGNLAQLARLFEAMRHDFLFQQLVCRAARHAAKVVRTLDRHMRRIGLRQGNERAVDEHHIGVVHDLLAGRRVDHAGCNGGDAGVAATDEHTRVAAHQKRRHRVVAKIGHVLRTALHDHAHDGVLQKRVASRADGNPLVGFRRDLRVRGVDDDELGAALHRLFDVMPVLNLRIGDVGAPHHDGLGVLCIGGLVTLPHGQAHQRSDVEAGNRLHAVEAAHVQARRDAAGIEDVLQTAVGARDARRLIARSGQKRERAFAVFGLGLLDVLGDFGQSLIPADALPLTRTALGSLHATHGILNTLGVVDAMHVRKAALADAAVAILVVRRARRLDHLAVAHMHVQMAEAETVRPAYSSKDRFALVVRLSRNEFPCNLRQPRLRLSA